MKKSYCVYSIMISIILIGCSNILRIETIVNKMDVTNHQESVWIEGNVQEIEEIENGYLLTILPLSEISNNNSEAVIVRANSNFKITRCVNSTMKISDLSEGTFVSAQIILDNHADEVVSSIGILTKMLILKE